MIGEEDDGDRSWNGICGSSNVTIVEDDKDDNCRQYGPQVGG